jgi:hypothetical protein
MKKGTSLFNVEVRRRGKFERVNARSLTLQEAFKMGESNVRSTAAASFKVTPVGGRTPTRSSVPMSFGESKKSPGVYVQKNRFRISSVGEKRQITLKGIAKNKSRGFLGKMFG